ncbi:MAG: hypothetical protein Q4G33_12770 [bacterium]|nr:hypothetical protein [bacterium]
MKLNVGKSKEIYDIYKTRVNRNQCYMNIYNVAVSSKLIKRFADGQIKIAYGAMYEDEEGFAVRHCFIVTKEQEVIDPTIFTFSGECHIGEIRYNAHSLYGCKEYLEAISKNDYCPDLLKITRTKDTKMFRDLLKKGIVYVGW